MNGTSNASQSWERGLARQLCVALPPATPRNGVVAVGDLSCPVLFTRSVESVHSSSVLLVGMTDPTGGIPGSLFWNYLVWRRRVALFRWLCVLLIFFDWIKVRFVCNVDVSLFPKALALGFQC